MSTNPSSYPDPTTDTDEELLERASRAELGPASLKQTPGSSEHPSGRVAAAAVEYDSGYEGSSVRRQPKNG